MAVLVFLTAVGRVLLCVSIFLLAAFAVLFQIWKIVEAHPKLKKVQGLFWSAHQRFFKQMLMAAKVPACAK